MLLRALLPLSILSLSLGLTSCGPKIPRATKTRDSGQSGMMGDTFAGQNACNPAKALRPFIIEWDATDKSSFEAYAASDIVVVRYEGCDMTVLEECRNDSIRGSQGAYKPVEWTSGALEKMDISNEGELHVKLPLSVGTLGGRVAGGEKFHMEYYVSGTRNATRDAVYRADIANNPGCEGATHFVYGYNLGAFALGSVTELNAGAEASLYGFGAGGSTAKRRAADKEGGVLSTCKTDTAREVEGCKAPIRLTLRPIREGENPQKEAMRAEDTDAALNAAGMVNAKVDMSKEAASRWDSAQAKMNARDGKGCLTEFDAYDRLEPKRKSSDPKTPGLPMQRAQCLMLAGKCDVGKVLMRKVYENTSAQWGPDRIDTTVGQLAALYCEGKLSPRDELLRGITFLNQASLQKVTVAECTTAYDAIRKNKDKVKPKDEDDLQITTLPLTFFTSAAACFAKAGDCKQARVVFETQMPLERYEDVKDPKQKAELIAASFDSYNPKCKAKAVK